MSRDSRTRFGDRVEAYVRYRPTYPLEVLDLLTVECALGSPRNVADIGSGTGIFTRSLLERGHTVFAVEPNAPMRRAAERSLAGYDTFRSIDGTAEGTTLERDSVDLVTSAQAFHWFDLDRSREEFQRILRPGGWIAVLWNDRRKATTSFLRAYEELLLRHGTDYQLVDHTRVTQEELAEFFGPGGFTAVRFDNHQTLDLAGLRGRIESCSYVPLIGEPGYEPMIEEIRTIFQTHQVAGRVRLDYDALVYYGQPLLEALGSEQ